MWWTKWHWAGCSLVLLLSAVSIIPHIHAATTNIIRAVYSVVRRRLKNCFFMRNTCRPSKNGGERRRPYWIFVQTRLWHFAHGSGVAGSACCLHGHAAVTVHPLVHLLVTDLRYRFKTLNLECMYSQDFSSITAPSSEAAWL